MESDLEKGGLTRLPYKPEGYSFWKWRGHKIHYVEQGEGSPVVLIHGFAASLFHWRYNIPELAKTHKVYAIDLLGFGWSEKALIEYDALVWRDQIVDFLKEKVKEPAILVGHGVGGFTALLSAAGLPEKVVGVALVNSEGEFGNAKIEPVRSEESLFQKFIMKPLKEIYGRKLFMLMFWMVKQPSLVESIMKSAYINSGNVDDYLVESLTKPADDPNAREVCYRLINKHNQKKDRLDGVLSKLSCPLLLLWGDHDSPEKAIKIKEFYPNASLVCLKAGVCPHDEVPELANKALVNWLATLTSISSPI